MMKEEEVKIDLSQFHKNVDQARLPLDITAVKKTSPPRYKSKGSSPASRSAKETSPSIQRSSLTKAKSELANVKNTAVADVSPGFATSKFLKKRARHQN